MSRRTRYRDPAARDSIDIRSCRGLARCGVHFHRGPIYAATMLRYDANELAQLPAFVTASFAGVGNPHAIAPLTAGEVVLDIGSGARTDLLLAARRTGAQGRAIGVDMIAAMRA